MYKNLCIVSDLINYKSLSTKPFPGIINKHNTNQVNNLNNLLFSIQLLSYQSHSYVLAFMPSYPNDSVALFHILHSFIPLHIIFHI